MILRIDTGLSPLLPCPVTRLIEFHHRIYLKGKFKGYYCSHCLDAYLALLREFIPTLDVIDFREERLYE